jgi:hypothetical protein
MPHHAQVVTFLAFASIACGQTITVNTSSDVVDFGGQQKIADLPGPDGKVSLEEAGLASDNTAGIQTIGFAIPQNEWEFQQFFPGRAVLRPFLGFRIFQPAILDATTQTEFTGDTYPDGGEVVIWQESYLIDNIGSEVRGFDSSSFHLSGGSGNKIQGNTNCGIEVFDSSFNLIGGSEPGQGNTGGTIQIDRASNNTLFGNTVMRVRILGWYGGGQPAVANRIGGPNPGERNFITGYGTWSEEGAPGGTTVQLFDSQGTIIENNSIGTTPDGMAQGHLASTSGIGFEGLNHGTLILNNRIAGILGHGIGPHYDGWLFGSAITVYGSGIDITIKGNTIGLNALGEPLLGSVTGIASYDYFEGPVHGVAIGGPNPGDGNQIAGHLTSGITVANPLTGVTISGNSIHDNEQIGIDLVTPLFDYGVTHNDAGDADAGGNGLQNFPELASAMASGDNTTILGAMDSAPSRTYTIEFFSSPFCDPTGYGEGEVYLGSAGVTTDDAGHAEISAKVSAAAPGSAITATATDQSTGDTSEFSACILAEGEGACYPDLTGDGVLDLFDFLAFVNAFNAADPSADCTGDGIFDLFDFLCFVNAFNAGC